MFENNIGEARRSYAMTTPSGKFTQEDAARAIGVAKGTYRNWEQGIGKGLKGEQLAKLSELYDVTVDYLLARTDRPNPEVRRPSDALTADERELLDIYRHLDPNGRETALRLLTALSPRAGDTGRVEEKLA